MGTYNKSKPLKSKKGKKRGNYKGKRRYDKRSHLQIATVRQPGAIVPDKMRTIMMYNDNVHSILTNSGLAYASLRYRPNAITDIDPTSATTVPAGFTEMASFYNFYRVLASGIEVYFSNLDTATNPMVMVLPLNLDPGSAPSLATIQGWLMNPYCRKYQLSGRGGMDRCVLRNYISTQKISGNFGVKYDDLYASQVTTTPSNTWYWAIGALEQGGGTFAYGLSFTLSIKIYVEFYDRKNLIN